MRRVAISEVSSVAVLLLVVLLSRITDIGHVAPFGSCQTMNWKGHTTTEGLDPTHGRCKLAVKKAGRIQVGMAQAASGKDEAIVENDKRILVDGTFDVAKTAYDNAKKSVSEAYQTARETMTESAKKEYESAKEKASKASGDLGAKMREGKEEM